MRSKIADLQIFLDHTTNEVDVVLLLESLDDKSLEIFKTTLLNCAKDLQTLTRDQYIELYSRQTVMEETRVNKSVKNLLRKLDDIEVLDEMVGASYIKEEKLCEGGCK